MKENDSSSYLRYCIILTQKHPYEWSAYHKMHKNESAIFHVSLSRTKRFADQRFDQPLFKTKSTPLNKKLKRIHQITWKYCKVIHSPCNVVCRCWRIYDVQIPLSTCHYDMSTLFSNISLDPRTCWLVICTRIQAIQSISFTSFPPFYIID